MAVKIHFLNVGAGDCTIIHFPKRIRTNSSGEKTADLDERITMIDLNHYDDHEEYENVLEYYRINFGNKPIFRLITTHPHHDHICGLHKLFGDNGIEVINYWDVPHNFKPESFEGHPWHEDDWETYEKIRNTSTSNPKTLNYLQENKRLPYWDEKNDDIYILSPTKELLKYSHTDSDNKPLAADKVEIDDISYALLIKINEVKVVLAGDGREKTWEEIMAHSNDLIENVQILKAPHHGSETAFHEKSIKHMNPDYVIFSTEASADSENGSDYLYHGNVPGSTILKTSDHGTIIASIDFEGNISFQDKNGFDLI